jgi:hypothetical protein
LEDEVKNYRVFLNDGSYEDHEGVVGIELFVIENERFLEFLFVNTDKEYMRSNKDYRYPFDMVYAFSILE